MAEESCEHMFLHIMFYILCFKHNVKKGATKQIGIFCSTIV